MMHHISKRLGPWACLGMSGLALGLSSCVPAPQPRPQPVVQTISPAPPPAPVLRSPSPIGWEEAPVTPGNWTYAKSASGSSATFGSVTTGSVLTLRCETATRRVTISRSGSAVGTPVLVIRTTFGAASWPATVVAGSQPGLGATRPASDPVFDQMAFSRGRFAIEGSGLPRIIAPAWAEVARVIEDCRG